jgi:hypothetical protein
MRTTYYIGDLGYVMHEEWEEVCDLSFPKDSPGDERTGRMLLKDGTEFFIFGTYFGDGEYQDQFGGTYGVDSGSIGAIRVEDIRDKTYSVEKLKRLGCFHTFETPLTELDCSSNEGLLKFGEIEIDTNPDAEYEEDEFD